MPSALSYPGVYIEEISSGVRTIVGVPTSVAAFVGRAARGPIDDPVVINGFGDFERWFGGLWTESTMSFALHDFFRNGGGQAVVVRAYQPEAPDKSGLAELKIDGDLTLVASSPGTWAKNLRARIDWDTRPGDDSLFNVTLALVQHDTGGKVVDIREIEAFRNVSLVTTHPRRVDLVLKAESRLVRAAADFAGVSPAAVTRPAESQAVDRDHPLWQADNTTSVGISAEGSDGGGLTQLNFTGPGFEAEHRGLFALDKADIFNLLCIPPFDSDTDTSSDLIDDAIAYCRKRRAVFLVDPPLEWTTKEAAIKGVNEATKIGSASRNAAIFFPRLREPNPLRENQLETFAPCGAVAGVIARTDGERGVWKAPAGLAAILSGVPDLAVKLTDAEIGELNPLGVNCLRPMPDVGRVVWGSRTREGSDRLASEWKYLPVRRLALYIEESLFRGTQWVVFEPNDEPLWGSIRLNVGSFMHSLFRQGAFQGRTSREAYEVKCDSETTTQDDIDRGIVNILVRFAPLKPAEFVVIKIQQLAGQVQV